MRYNGTELMSDEGKLFSIVIAWYHVMWRLTELAQLILLFVSVILPLNQRNITCYIVHDFKKLRWSNKLQEVLDEISESSSQRKRK